VFNEAFKAIADPTRREILRILAGGEKSAGELADQFEMTKPTVSHHFQVLKDADLVSTRREGTRIYYRLNTTVTQDLLRWMWDAFGQPEASGSSKPESKKKA
jgi:DNA-binding transcriptional ArsR family regulator